MKTTWKCARALAAALAVAWAGVEARAAVVLTRQQAVNAVVTQLGLGGPNDDTRVWCTTFNYGFGPGFDGVLPAGTVVRPARYDTKPNPGNQTVLSGPMYLFFVDPVPIGMYPHDLSFVYVDATVSSPTLAAGTIIAQGQGWWPRVEATGYPAEEQFDADTRSSFAPASYLNGDGLCFGPHENTLLKTAEPGRFHEALRGELDPTRGGGGPAPVNPAGIIVTGTAGGAAGTAEAGVEGSADSMKTELQGHGVPAGRIQDKRNAKKSDVTAAVTAICALVPPPDKIFVYIGSHGGKDEIQLGTDGMVPAKDLKDILKPLGAKNVQVCLLIEACHSGSLIDDLRELFPKGIIITAADADNRAWSGSIRKADGTKKGDFGFFGWAFIDCWKDPAADTDGDGRVNWAEAFKWVTSGGRGKVKWHGNGKSYDTNDKNPKLSGLPEKVERWQGPISGTWYTEIWRDTDQDGEYDQHDWSIDANCDGIPEFIYLEDDKDEDGKKERVVCFSYTPTGTPIQKYEFLDPNDDGKVDTINCFNWNGSSYVLTASAPRRPDGVGFVSPSTGPASGGTPCFVQTPMHTWGTAPLMMFMGSHMSSVVRVGPTQLQGVNNGYIAGVSNLIVVDFNNTSPSFGFAEYENAFNYVRSVQIDSIDPASAECNQSVPMTIHGAGFDPGALVRIGGIPVPASWEGSNTMSVFTPVGLCGGSHDVEVINPPSPNSPSSNLRDGFTVGGPPDVVFPIIIPPAPIIVQADGSGLGRAPASFVATASDDSGTVNVFTNTLGALPVGTWPVLFEAVDPSLNRTYGSSQITVQSPPPTCPGDINHDGRTNTADLAILLGQFGQSGPGLSGDLNGDNTVNTADLVILLAAFGCGT